MNFSIYPVNDLNFIILVIKLLENHRQINVWKPKDIHHLNVRLIYPLDIINL